MGKLLDFLLNMLSQFAGGPGPPENNLVRFGLAAILWSALLATAWSRQRRQDRVRERLLVVGFGLALFRELFKLGHLSFKMVTGVEHAFLCAIVAPAEHALTLASVVVIAAAFLRYILDDALLTRRYLMVGLGATGLMTITSAVWWPQQLLVEPTIRFHETWLASVIHLFASALIALVLVVLIQRRGWLRNVVVFALFLLFVSELLVYINFVTAHAFTTILCPVGNAIYLLAIPVFGYVYYHEQQNERLRAEVALRSYRDHLEELVKARTTEIIRANRQLKDEIGERKQAEMELAQRNAELAAQNALAATISQSLELDSVLESALDRAVDLMAMAYGCIFLIDQDADVLVLRTQRSSPSAERMPGAYCRAHLCNDVSQQAIARMTPVIHETVARTSSCHYSPPPKEPAVHTLVSTPLISQNHAVGALTLGAPRADAFSPEALDLLIAIGQQIGVAVEKAYLHHQLELAASLEERQRIAAEMHDGLAQTLSYIGLKTDRAAALLEEGQIGQVTDWLHQLRDAIGQATYEVRRSIASLQERPAPRQSLQEAIRQAVETFEPDGTPTIIVADDLSAPLFPPTEALGQAVRVVQEALTNALRHAKAQTIQIRMQDDKGRITITVQDDGCGFDPQVPAANGVDHFGLSIMRARAARLGGELIIQSEQGSGTRVILTLSLETEASQAGSPSAERWSRIPPLRPHGE